jgi:hypothetical protein
VIDPETQALLQDIVRRESQSILSYVREAFPWVGAKGAPALSKLRQLSEEESEAVAALGRYLARRRAPATFLGSFPSSFTTLNFLALEHLVPRLIAYEHNSIADLERSLARIGDPEAQAQVAMLLEVKRRNLAQLENLHAPPAEIVKAQ